VRVRVGVGMPEYKEMLLSYLTKPMNKAEADELASSVSTGAEAVMYLLENNLAYAMNKYN
jgi:peptidyl-tRNA hydrolase